MAGLAGHGVGQLEASGPRSIPGRKPTTRLREWSGYFAASAYADFHDIEYNAIR